MNMIRLGEPGFEFTINYPEHLLEKTECLPIGICVAERSHRICDSIMTRKEATLKLSSTKH